MQKKIIIAIGGVTVLVLGGLFYVYMTFFNGTDFSKNVPKNAIMVMKVDLMGMGRKINLKEASESKVFRKEVLENMKSSQKEMIEKVIENPTKSGLHLASDPTLFVYNHAKSEEEAVMGFLFGISDKKNFNAFLEQMAKDITIKEPDQDGFYSANLGSEKFVLYFNDKVGLMLFDIDNKDIILKRVRDEILALDKDNSILTNEDYTSLNKQTNDMMVYFNGAELTKVLEINKIEVNDEMKKSLKSVPYAMTLNFIEDAISLKILGSTSKEASANAIYKANGLSETELKNIDPKGSPLAYFAANIDAKKLVTLVSEQPTFKQGGLSMMNLIENFAAELSIPKDDLLSVVDGKMSLSFSGIKPRNLSDTLLFQPTTPLVNGWFHLGNKEAATKILDYLTTTGLLVNKDGIYTENTSFKEPEMFVTIKGNDLFYSTQLEPIQNKALGKEWDGLKESLGKKDVLAKPAAAFVDLRYSSYEPMIKSEMNSTQFEAFQKFKNILSSFKSMSIKGDNKEAEMVIQFTEKKTNSLQRIIELLQEAYRLTS
jgi:hypothetical protein